MAKIADPGPRCTYELLYDSVRICRRIRSTVCKNWVREASRVARTKMTVAISDHYACMTLWGFDGCMLFRQKGQPSSHLQWFYEQLELPVQAVAESFRADARPLHTNYTSSGPPTSLNNIKLQTTCRGGQPSNSYHIVNTPSQSADSTTVDVSLSDKKNGRQDQSHHVRYLRPIRPKVVEPYVIIAEIKEKDSVQRSTNLSDIPARSSAPQLSLMATTSGTTAELDVWKRKYSALEAITAAGSELPDKIQLRVRQRNLGRGFRRIVHMFYAPSDLVACNIRYVAAQISGKEPDKDDGVMQKAYHQLTQFIPLVVSPLIEQNDLGALYENLLKGADSAWGDDALTLKRTVVMWLHEIFGPSAPSLVASTKDGRGFHNAHTGRLLCPVEFDWDDEAVRAAIRAGDEQYAVTASSWPNICYANFTCNPDNLEEGLWKNALMVKAYKCIFTSPSSAVDDKEPEESPAPPTKRRRTTKPATKQNVASKIGLKSVTGRSIAYVAVQLRFALSSASSWNPLDMDFCYIDFYAAVVAYFETPPGPVAAEHIVLLLQWWNTQIFRRDRGTVAVPLHSDLSMQRMREQRQARENSLAAAAIVVAAAAEAAVNAAAVATEAAAVTVAEAEAAVAYAEAAVNVAAVAAAAGATAVAL
ncbi:hypothetical protein FIBSPDRAFT_930434 [Athelia psychrophila]|uniref:Uncharacterized protein n=1 Tax=Athelia psychrophila TaxID=1759441 RepID=A0A166M520_9AGAM|nr:hypothetical protein FIBSPDRAFT_930434 [Fibularhizoctonia sp. CBS 109695]